MERPLEGSSDPRKPPRPCWNCDKERQGQPGESGGLPVSGAGSPGAGVGDAAAGEETWAQRGTGAGGSGLQPRTLELSAN